MRYCNECNVLKPLNEYEPGRGKCNDCRKAYKLNYYRTKEGLLKKMFNSQIQRTNKSGMIHNYSFDEFKNWIYTNNYEELFYNWKESGYKTTLVPSVDRINNFKGYTLDNIELVTWAENRRRGHADRKSGKLFVNNRPIIRYDSRTKILGYFHSTREAERNTRVDHSSISRCISLGKKDKDGFYWRDATQEEINKRINFG